MMRLARAALALLIPLALASCVLAPGRFVSKLIINADRSFTFSYVGQVIAVDIGNDMTRSLGAASSDDSDKPNPDDSGYDDGPPTLQDIGWQDKGGNDPDTSKKVAADAKNAAIAQALSKEAGYRKVAYLGDGKFDIDYAITGRLDHIFVWPFNVDAELVFPFIAIELRANNTVRVKAPAFANESRTSSMPGADAASSKLDGIFTLDTDAEIVSQNEESGPVATGARKTITWKATPLTKSAPMAVLRLSN